uniref:Histidine kinase n=1 Tax=Sexangularia sp. CB-2014 TaxID=1486929 RepID=A0A7S1V2Y5_9EUKA|mmetsp:Transcript_10649/g.33732  ORF Transcript_10649/g.33732 Transcript_10649/m.33732 type:complete len:909 (+) Transcript_10649:89-2815(+)
MRNFFSGSPPPAPESTSSSSTDPAELRRRDRDVSFTGSQTGVSTRSSGVATSFFSMLARRLAIHKEPKRHLQRKVVVASANTLMIVSTIGYIAYAVAAGTVMANLPILVSLGVTQPLMFALVLHTRSYFVATIVAHVLTLSIAAAVFEGPLSNGIVAPPVTGDVADPSIVVAFIIMPCAAFMFREKATILAYGILTFILFIVTSTATCHNDNCISSLVLVTIPHVFVVAAFAYFSEVADALAEQSEEAGIAMKKAQREARADRRANAAKTRFVAVMSHEIRNPLQAILLQLEMLNLTPLAMQQLDYVKGITRASNLLLSIVNDVMDVTKIESGVIALESAEFNMREACEFTLQTVAPAAARKDIALFLSFPSDLSPWVRGDVTRVRQVLHNLLGNALKFTMDGEVEMIVSRDSVVRASSDGPAYEWTVSVRDTGIGINEEGQQKLFREFSQVDESTTREYGGTGLGLFICKQLSELMGGSVSVESEMGVGSTFHVSFVLEESTSKSNDEDRSPPVAIASTTITWNCFMFGRNRAYVESTCAYLRYFFESAKDAHVRGLNNASTVVSTMRASLAQLKDSDDARILLLVDRCAEESNQEQEMAREVLKLAESHPGKFIPILVAYDPPATVRQQYIDEGWRFLVQKPVMLANLCTTLADSLDDDSTGNIEVPTANSFRPGKAKATLSNRPSGSKATSGHHTLTRGKRLEPFSEEDAAAVAGSNAPLVMVVDDFQLVRDLVQKVIASLGYRTQVAANGAEALEAIKSDYTAYSMVMMDCEMPVMDGFAATQAIRAFESSKEVPEALRLPICAMTANAMREDVAKCLRIGMDDFLSKPVKRDDLKSKLQQRTRRVVQTDDGEYVMDTQTDNAAALTKKGSSRSKRRKAKAKQPGDPGDARTTATPPPLLPEGP